MGTPSRSQLLGIVATGMVIVVLGALWARGGGASEAGAGTPRGGSVPQTVSVSDAPGAGATILVHVAGAVRHPGVYRVRDGARVQTAIRRAGGATHQADLDALNLAAKLTDGRQVLVPSRVRAVASASGTASGTSAAPAGAPVNLNSATVEELDVLDGIGPTTAQKIVDYREEHGGFSSVDDLDSVPGIGPATVESLRDAVTV